MLARPTIFFPTAFRVGSIPFFLNFDDIEKIRPASIQTRTPPFSSEFLEKFSAYVQIRTLYSTFLIFDIL